MIDAVSCGSRDGHPVPAAALMHRDRPRALHLQVRTQFS